MRNVLQFIRWIFTYGPFWVVGLLLIRERDQFEIALTSDFVGEVLIFLAGFLFLYFMYYLVIMTVGLAYDDPIDRAWVAIKGMWDRIDHRPIVEQVTIIFPTDAEWSSILEWDEVDDYQEYLASEEWEEKRVYLFRRALFRCQVCNGKGPLEVHHRTYERVGHEYPIDLTVLCRDCHGIFHRSGQLATGASG